MTNDEFGAAAWRARSIPPPPPIGPDWAQQMHFTKDEYNRAKGWHQILWERHIQAGLPGAPPRPDGDDRTTFLLPSAAIAGELLGRGARELLDPCLTEANDEIIHATNMVDELDRWPNREFGCDGEAWTVARARLTAAELSRQIQRDTEKGHLHHRRTGRSWGVLANLLMLLDLVAIIVVFADLFNVDYRRPLATPAESLAATFLPVILVLAQLWAAQTAGRRYNELRELEKTADAHAAAAARKARRWTAITAALALPLTALLLVRLYVMSQDADLGTLWQVVLIGLALAIGLGAPLVKVWVVAEDGSHASRRRDKLDQQLGRQRQLWTAELRQAKDSLDQVRRAHDDYVSQLRPLVLQQAAGPMAEAENALGLLTVMLGSGRSGLAGSRRPRVEPGADQQAVLFPLLRWGIPDAPEVDNQPLHSCDEIYRRQLARAEELHQLISGQRTPHGPPTPCGRELGAADPIPLPPIHLPPGSVNGSVDG